ncbi:unnamed protein product, partial [Closterium sp. Naga37s-1]
MPLENRTLESMLTFLLVLFGACLAHGAKTSIYELLDSPLLQNKYVMSPENVWNAYPAASVVVSTDGTGNFTSVQDAVDYVSSTGTTSHAVIDILPGTYRDAFSMPKPGSMAEQWQRSIGGRRLSGLASYSFAASSQGTVGFTWEGLGEMRVGQYMLGHISVTLYKTEPGMTGVMHPDTTPPSLP